jgi:hypothetical protein
MMPRTYPDTPAGWLDMARDGWKASLSAAGHRMAWRKVGRITMNTRNSHHYRGTCRRCGGQIDVGEYWSVVLAGNFPSLVLAGRPRKCPGPQGGRR